MPFQAPSERKFCILSVTPMCPKCALCSSSGMLACKLIHPRQLLQGPDLDFVYRSHGHTHFPGNLVPGQPLKIGNTNYHGLPFFQQGGVVFVPILRSRSRYVSKRFKTCAFISVLIIQAPFPIKFAPAQRNGEIQLEESGTVKASSVGLSGEIAQHVGQSATLTSLPLTL